MVSGSSTIFPRSVHTKLQLSVATPSTRNCQMPRNPWYLSVRCADSSQSGRSPHRWPALEWETLQWGPGPTKMQKGRCDADLFDISHVLINNEWHACPCRWKKNVLLLHDVALFWNCVEAISGYWPLLHEISECHLEGSHLTGDVKSEKPIVFRWLRNLKTAGCSKFCFVYIYIYTHRIHDPCMVYLPTSGWFVW